MSETVLPLEFPRERLVDLELLVALGDEKLKKLGLVFADESQALTLDVRAIAHRVAPSLEVSTKQAERLLDVLWMLDAFRAGQKLDPDAFFAALTAAVDEVADEAWKARHRERWTALRAEITALLQRDSLISFVRKAYDLLFAHPANLREYRVLTEVRPVFDEAATRIRALLLTNSLVLTFDEGGRERTSHFAIDLNDLRLMKEELERAERKNEVTVRQAQASNLKLVFYGPDRTGQ